MRKRCTRGFNYEKNVRPAGRFLETRQIINERRRLLFHWRRDNVQPLLRPCVHYREQKEDEMDWIWWVLLILFIIWVLRTM
jgi:hypothetical protein